MTYGIQTIIQIADQVLQAMKRFEVTVGHGINQDFAPTLTSSTQVKRSFSGVAGEEYQIPGKLGTQSLVKPD